MIKLKNILREAGLVKEQANQSQVLNVTPGDTQQQLQQLLDNSGFDLTNPVTINLTFDQNLPDNDIPRSDQLTRLQTTLTAINTIGKNVSTAVNAGTTSTLATGEGAPTALLTPAGTNFANAFPQIANVYSDRTDNTPSNDFLLLNRAGAVYQAAINAGIRKITTTIPTDGTATSSTRFATLSVTGVFKKDDELLDFDQYFNVYNVRGLAGSLKYSTVDYLMKILNIGTSIGSFDVSDKFKSEIPNPEALNPVIERNNKVSLNKKTMPYLIQAFDVKTPEEVLIRLGAKQKSQN